MIARSAGAAAPGSGARSRSGSSGALAGMFARRLAARRARRVALLLGSDPTGLTLVIILVFVAATLWCGMRARELQRQRRLLDAPAAAAAQGWAASTGPRWLPHAARR